jgi:hypothetical protein
MRVEKIAAVGVLLLGGCTHRPPVRAPLTEGEAATQARGECEAFAKETSTTDVDRCVAELAPRILDADRARARADAAVSVHSLSPSRPPVPDSCRWRVEYTTRTDCR